MFGPEPIVISMPARELSDPAIPGSVFDVAELDVIGLSPDLRLAVDLIAGAYHGVDAPIRCVVRPEIFTHGASLAWLKNQLGKATDHICLSDGTSVKLIPHLRNHLFTYGLHAQRHQLEFKKLMRRAPELLGQYDSQVNSFHRIAADGLAVEPTPHLVMPSAPRRGEAAWFYDFYLNPHSAEDSAERMLDWGTLQAPPLAEYREITYIPLTECVMKDASFQRVVTEMIASTFFEPKNCLLLRLPPGEDLRERMRLTIEGLRSAGLRLPQARSSNIFLVGDDLPEETLKTLGSRLSLMLHQTFDYWRYTRAVYGSAAKIVVILDADWKRPSDAAKKLLREAFGQAPRFLLPVRAPEIEWTPE